jgi:hypothetical protein
MPISYWINEKGLAQLGNGSEFEAIQASFRAWENVPSANVRFIYRGTTQIGGVAHDGANVVSFTDTTAPLGSSTIAATFSFFRSEVGSDNVTRRVIDEADIVFNPSLEFSTSAEENKFDIQSVLTHEIGHLLGLKHSSIAGSIMAEHIGRDSDQYFGPRAITSADAAAIRELYGVDSDDCCGSISGRISGLGRNVKNVSVWIEDSESRLTGHADVAPDGSYRVGGLSEGKYEAFWRSGATFGDLGTVAVDAGGTTTLSKRISPEKTDLSLDLIGLNMQPGEAAVSLRPGRQYYLCLTGSGFGTLASISFSSKYIHANASTINKADFGMKFDAATVTVTVDPDAPAGAYTVFAERADGAKSALVGAILVTR